MKTNRIVNLKGQIWILVTLTSRNSTWEVWEVLVILMMMCLRAMMIVTLRKKSRRKKFLHRVNLKEQSLQVLEPKQKLDAFSRSEHILLLELYCSAVSFG